MLKFLAGGVAGLLAWMIMEPSAPRNLASHEWASWQATLVLLLGAFVGVAVGGLDGFTRGGKVHTTRGLVMGLVFGAVGASFGSSIGAIIVGMTFGSSVFFDGNIMARIPARVVALVPVGMFLGLAIGASSLTFKRALQGLIGGGLGGAIAGASFDVIGSVFGQSILAAKGIHGGESGEVGTLSRALSMVVMGAAIGLFIGLVERYSRSAWLRLSLGRNEGKEWSIDGPRTFIGRSESANVPLFGDTNVAPIHASIDRHGNQYVLNDGGSPLGTYVNGQRVQQAVLQQGSQIQIGGFVLQFLLKGSPAPYRGPEAYAGQSYPMGGAMPQPGYQPMPGGQPMAPAQPQPAQPRVTPFAQPTGNPTQVLTPAASMPTMAYGAPMGQAPAGFVLVALDGPLLGQRFPVTGAMDVGRECPSIPMSFDNAASRKHATLSPSFNGIAVNDAGSTNGTFLNGQRVSQATAAPGDMLKIGSTTFRVEAA
ncbi:MAG: FHA domain-containing protein [Fimbriimonas sp.]|nr:FHA domain-containing protein [Fimbriimonas sp.]